MHISSVKENKKYQCISSFQQKPFADIYLYDGVKNDTPWYKCLPICAELKSYATPQYYAVSLTVYIRLHFCKIFMETLYQSHYHSFKI